MPAPADRPEPELRSYLTGFVLALVLSAIPFALVASGALAPMATLVVIAVLAIVQILVHLRYFLHLDLRSSPPENLLALVFAAILIFIMIGGSLWIMFDLRARMMF
jgi:cytochrome o ubiquinol oxidase operon protein cyoD